MLIFLKKHWILLLSVFLLVLMVLPILYFGTLFRMLDNRSENQINLRSNPDPILGICFNNLIEGHSMIEKEVFLSEAKIKKVSVQIRVAHYSLTRQIKQIRGLIRENVKVLIIAPVSKNGLADVLQEAAQKKIKIVLFDELTNGPVDLYCGVDYLKIGKIQATYLAKRTDRGRYLILRGSNNSYKADQIAQGQVETLKIMLKNNIRILTQSLPGWSPEEAALKARTQAMLENVNAILTPNDIIAEEIIKLFEKEGQKLPYIGGVGGERKILRRIISDGRLVTVASDYETLAKIGFDTALKLAAGKRVMFSKSVVYNSKKIPAIIGTPQLINQVNADLQIKKQHQIIEE